MEEATAAQLLAAYEGALTTAKGESIAPCEALLKALKAAAENDFPLSSIDLRGNIIGGPGGAPLGKMLALDSFITFANLEEIDLGDEGVTAVADALRNHPAVFRLDLGYNAISGKGAKAVERLMTDSPSLLCLDLSGNNFYARLGMLTPAALSALAPIGRALAAPTCKLQLLHLDRADIEHKGLTALVDGLLKNETLLNLRLGENALDAKARPALISPPAPAPLRTRPSSPRLPPRPHPHRSARPCSPSSSSRTTR